MNLALGASGYKAAISQPSHVIGYTTDKFGRKVLDKQALFKVWVFESCGALIWAGIASQGQI